MKQSLMVMRDMTQKVHAWMKRNSTELVMKHCGLSTVRHTCSVLLQRELGVETELTVCDYLR